jgi:hypothetical protein
MKHLPISLALFLASFSILAQQVIHVTPDGAGAKDGTCWANATDLNTAIGMAEENTSVLWLRDGIYYLTSTLIVPTGVSVFGGFNGTENELEQRNYATNPTIIDAQQQFAVVDLGIGAILNGVTVRNGVANIPTRMSGGGVLMRAGSRIEYCYIMNNIAVNYGGGIYVIDNANAHVFNTVIAENKAGKDGFAIYGEAVIFRSNTVVDNVELDCAGLPDATFEKEICNGQTTILTATVATVGTTYSWNTGQTTQSITTPTLTAHTTYTVTITAPSFCVLVQTFEITVKPTPTLTVETDRTFANPSEMGRFTAIAEPSGGDYLWNNTVASTDTFIVEQMPEVGDLQFTVTYILNGCWAIPVTTTIRNTERTPPVVTPGTTHTFDSRQSNTMLWRLNPVAFDRWNPKYGRMGTLQRSVCRNRHGNSENRNG